MSTRTVAFCVTDKNPRIRLNDRSVKREASQTTFANAAKVKRPIVLDRIGNFRKATGCTVLEIFDHPAVWIQAQHKCISFRCGLKKGRKPRNYLPQEWMWKKLIKYGIARCD